MLSVAPKKGWFWWWSVFRKGGRARFIFQKLASAPKNGDAINNNRVCAGLGERERGESPSSSAMKWREENALTDKSEFPWEVLLVALKRARTRRQNKLMDLVGR